MSETYGAVIYQEQIMSLAQRLAGFTRGESAAKSLCGKIWADWWSVSSIAFNKSHAVAYTRLAWQSAYLKARHPREYAEAFAFCYNVVEDNKSKKDVQ